ncbi:hypothetical protein [Parvibaculum sp.]|nr:hypothetical protein [Parvibaculum sp.]
MHAPREHELDMLDENYGSEWSHLSCQLVMTSELDGLRVRVADIATREVA